MFWTFTVSYIVLASSYAVTIWLLLRKLSQLSVDGGLEIEVKGIKNQFLFFFIGFVMKFLFYLF